MSVSTDAILCYGFQIGEEDEKPEIFQNEEGDVDFNDFVLKKFGQAIKKPNEFKKEDYDSNPEVRDAWRAYWSEKSALVKSVGVDLVTHCSADYPMYILAVTASVKNARRGYPVPFESDITVDPEWRRTLADFCEKAGIEMQEPSYILCSYWG